MTIKAGDFTIDVYEPYPVQVTLRHVRSGDAFHLNHMDLADLQYAVNRAVALAAAKLNPKEAAAAGLVT